MAPAQPCECIHPPCKNQTACSEWSRREEDAGSYEDPGVTAPNCSQQKKWHPNHSGHEADAVAHAICNLLPKRL